MSYLPVKFVFSLKSRLLFNVFYFFCMFVNKHSRYVKCTYLKRERCYNVQSAWYYFYMKTNILQDFHICISVPLRKPPSWLVIILLVSFNKIPLFSKELITFYVLFHYLLDLVLWFRVLKIPFLIFFFLRTSTPKFSRI